MSALRKRRKSISRKGQCPICGTNDLSDHAPDIQAISGLCGQFGFNGIPNPAIQKFVEEDEIILKQIQLLERCPRGRGGRAGQGSLPETAEVLTALTRTLVEVRYELAIRESNDLNKFFDRWFGPAQAALSEIRRVVNPLSPDRVQICGILCSADTLTYVPERNHFADLVTAERPQQSTGASHLLAQSRFGKESVTRQLVEKTRSTPSGLILKYERDMWKRREESPNREDWDAEAEMLGFDQGDLLLVPVADLGTTSILIAVWSADDAPLCPSCRWRAVLACLDHRGCFYTALIHRLSRATSERHVIDRLMRMMRKAVSVGDDGRWSLGEPVMVWWEAKGDVDILQRITVGPLNRRESIYFACSDHLEHRPNKQNPTVYPFPKAGDRPDRRLAHSIRFWLIHLAEAHGIRWPMPAGSLEKRLRQAHADCQANCAPDLFSLWKIHDDASSTWEHDLERALPYGFREGHVDWDNGKGTGIRLKGPFFIQRSGSIGMRRSK